MKEARHKKWHIAWFHLCEIPRIGKSIKTVELWLPKVDKFWGMDSDRQWVWDFFLRWWKCSKIDCGIGCTTLWRYLKTIDFYTFFFLATACRILVPQPGIEPTPPVLGAWCLNHWTTREASDLYTLNGQVVWYVNNISIKLFCVFIFFLFPLAPKDSKKGIEKFNNLTKVTVRGDPELKPWNLAPKFIHTPTELTNSADGSFALQCEDLFHWIKYFV